MSEQDSISVAETVNSAQPEAQVTDTQQGAAEAATPNADTQLLGESASETAGNEGDALKSSNNVPAKDRIAQLVSQRNQEKAAREQAEHDAAYWRNRVEALTPKPAGNEADHPDDASYRKAIVQETITEAQRAAAIQSAQEAEQRALRIRAQSFETRVSEFREKAPDFEAVAYRLPQQGGPHITDWMAEAIKESESGPQVAYWLGKNTTEAARIALLAPIKQVAEIGKLEAQLSIPAKRTTEAPRPPKTVSGANASSSQSAEEMDHDTYRAMRMGKKGA